MPLCKYSKDEMKYLANVPQIGHYDSQVHRFVISSHRKLAFTFTISFKQARSQAVTLEEGRLIHSVGK